MSGPVLWGVDPIGNEGLMSLVTRTVTRNILPSSHVLLRQVGAGHANNPTAAMIAGLDEHRLATILRQPVEEIARRRHLPRPEPGFVDFFGVAVRSDEMVFRRRRFGPAAVCASPHARAIWSLKTVPCCTEHWQYLVDACGCGAVQRWQSADRLDRCDVCNAPLAQVPAVKVEPDLRDGLAFLLGLIDPEEARRSAARAMLPVALAGWDGGMILELALALMPLTTDGYAPRRGDPTPAADQVVYATSLSRTADLVRGWPATLVPALEDAVTHRSRSRRNVRYTGVTNYLPALASEVMPDIVRSAINEALAPIASAAGEVPPEQIGMMEAAERLGRPLQLLAPARRAGRLRTHICIRANRIFPSLDRAEVEYLRDFGSNRISVEKASDSYDLPAYAMTLIADAGRITPESHPFLLAHYGDPQLHAVEYRRFKDAVRAAAVRRSSDQPDDRESEVDVFAAGPATEPLGIADPVSLHRAARAIGGGLKPWGAILDRLLSGDIPFAITGDRVSRIEIGSEDAVAFRKIDLTSVTPSWLPPTCSQRDALEILNLPGKHADLLKTFAGADDDWEIPWSAVLDLARTRITLTEMCARTGVQGVRLEKLMEDGGCPRLDRFGWLRDPALATLRRLADRKGGSPLARTGGERSGLIRRPGGCR